MSASSSRMLRVAAASGKCEEEVARVDEARMEVVLAENFYKEIKDKHAELGDSASDLKHVESMMHDSLFLGDRPFPKTQET